VLVFELCSAGYSELDRPLILRVHYSCLNAARRRGIVFALATTMTTVEIARSDWEKSLDAFSAVHEGWLISLEVLSAGLGAQPLITDLPLVGVTLDDREGQSIAIAAERSAKEHTTHFVPAPARLWLERTDDGVDVALQIEAADGTRTIVELKTPARSETVDGVPAPHAQRH